MATKPARAPKQLRCGAARPSADYGYGRAQHGCRAVVGLGRGQSSSRPAHVLDYERRHLRCFATIPAGAALATNAADCDVPAPINKGAVRLALKENGSHEMPRPRLAADLSAAFCRHDSAAASFIFSIASSCVSGATWPVSG